MMMKNVEKRDPLKSSNDALTKEKYPSKRRSGEETLAGMEAVTEPVG